MVEPQGRFNLDENEGPHATTWVLHAVDERWTERLLGGPERSDQGDVFLKLAITR